MLTNSEKRTIERALQNRILANPSGIDTRLLNQSVFDCLHNRIPNLNRHHIAGMLSWVYRAYNHTFLVRSPGRSIIV